MLELTLLNILIALLVSVIARWLLSRCGVSDPANAIITALVGLLAFLLNLADRWFV